MHALEKLPNIGAVVAAQLVAVGIETPDQLMQVGSREAWLKIRSKDPSACYSRLCGLEGAICGIRWHNLPDDAKADLKAFYNAHK